MSDLTEVPDLMGKLDAAIAVVRADEREKALADAHARIEDLHYAINQCPIRPDASSSVGSVKSDDNLLIGTGYQLAVNDALAALNQPQTGRLAPDVNTPAQFKEFADRGGAATPRGVADANLEGDEPSETEAVARVKAVMKAGRDAGSGVFDSNSVFRFGTHGVAALLNFLERDGWEVIHTGVYAQPQKWIQAEAELEDQPGPYAKAFRERVCPVPEFPGIKNRQEDQA